MTQGIDAKDARYIKLGREGRWEQLCLEDGTTRRGNCEVPHDLASSGDRRGLRQHFVDQGHKPPTATSHTNQVLSFYESGPETLWITFSAGYLWWAIAEGPVEFLGGSVEEMEERGSRLRRTRDGWHNSSVGGTPLRIPELSGALTKTASYQMTICSVDSLDYLIRKINDQDLPEVAAARSARSALLRSTTDLMRLLTWRDFELLIELVFSQSGWRRISASGGTQKTIDIELVLPTTGEAAFVQVKSKTNQVQLDDYIERFAERDDARMFYVYHTSQTTLTCADDRVILVGPDRLAEMVMDTGLFGWLLKKAG